MYVRRNKPFRGSSTLGVRLDAGKYEDVVGVVALESEVGEANLDSDVDVGETSALPVETGNCDPGDGLKTSSSAIEVLGAHEAAIITLRVKHAVSLDVEVVVGISTSK